MEKVDLATLRLCQRTDCTFAVLNGITDLKDILMAMSNHIASMHPAAGGSEGGGEQEDPSQMLQYLL